MAVRIFKLALVYANQRRRSTLAGVNTLRREMEMSSRINKWDKSKYLGGVHEYKRLELAKEIDEECALKSASWGMFQIMGFNHLYCGCKDVFEFVKKMHLPRGSS